jgi:adenosylcobyric acid synthase
VARPPAGPPIVDGLDVAVVRFPFASNVTDLDALAIEPGVAVRLVRTATEIGRPDLVVLPGTKATVADLAWLRAGGFPDAIVASGADVLGICGGYQMLGDKIDDPVESGRGVVPGLGWLAARTVFEVDKVVRRVGTTGYEIHHGRVAGEDISPDGRVRGTTVHGLFEDDAIRTRFLVDLASRHAKCFVPAGMSFAATRTARLDVLADAIEAHVDIEAIERLIESGLRA